MAGEGIALASVAALLAGLIQWRLAAIAPAAAGAALAETAQRLTAGDPAQATHTGAAVSAAQLRQAYADGFALLARTLAAITAVSAMAIYLLLGQTAQCSAEIGPPAGAASAATDLTDAESAWRSSCKAIRGFL